MVSLVDRREKKGSLRKRLTLFIIIGISIILLTFGIASHFIIQKSIDDSLNEKLILSRLIRNNIDSILRENITRLYDISLSGRVDLSDGTLDPEKEAIKTAYRYSLFTDGIFLLDRGGNIVVNYPERIRDTALNILSIEPVGRIIASGKPIVSDLYTVEPTQKKVLYVLVPLKDKNGIEVGVVGGQIDPTNPLFIQKLGLIDIGKNEFIDLVDSRGVVITSSNRARAFTQCNRDNFFPMVISAREERVTRCHICHENGAGKARDRHESILAFVPLETAPWGIAVQEPRDDVFAPAIKLQKTFLFLGLIFIATFLVLTIGINRSIVDPLKELIRGTDRIARGDLTQPVSLHGSDEIGVLSQSFETMRTRLAESRESLRRYNLELESRVRERTQQIHLSQKRSAYLLKKIISSQEEERKRIGRHLHDATLQDLSAVIMQIDICRIRPGEISPGKIDKIREIVLSTWDGVISIIQNLRPTLLDDLGLTAAIKSLLDKHLRGKEIDYFVNTAGVKDMRFRPEVEITLFRIIQEAIINIARHANAKNVFLLFSVTQESLSVEVEDDGEGFDMSSVLSHPPLDGIDRRGLGLLGMRERAQLLGGKFNICSQPGVGTTLNLCVPLTSVEVKHV